MSEVADSVKEMSLGNTNSSGSFETVSQIQIDSLSTSIIHTLTVINSLVSTSQLNNVLIDKTLEGCWGVEDSYKCRI